MIQWGFIVIQWDINGIYHVCLWHYLNIYHLVMTNSSPWKDPPIFKFGKPSISIRAIYTMAMLNSQRVFVYI